MNTTIIPFVLCVGAGSECRLAVAFVVVANNYIAKPFEHALASRAHILVQIFLRTLIIGMRHQTSPLRFYKYNRPMYVYAMIVAAIKLPRIQCLQIW